MVLDQSVEEVPIASGLVLFLSADIVGSTAYKNKHVDRVAEHPWLEHFRQFFTDFPASLEDRCFQEFRIMRYDVLDTAPLESAPGLWKSAGDELIFSMECHSPAEVIKTIIAFRDAVILYSSHMKAKESSLALKATAWLAGYPVVNAMIEAPDKTTDFIGPSMDIGFRLGKLSSERKFSISLELAYLLADQETHGLDSALQIFFDGESELKGVLGGKQYPMFWVNMLTGPALVDKLLGLEKKPAALADIRKYCQDFVRRHGNETVLCLPYISPGIYGEPPEKHSAIIGAMGKKRKATYDSAAEGSGGDKDVNVPLPTKKTAG